jgi:hypothetical protein
MLGMTLVPRLAESLAKVAPKSGALRFGRGRHLKIQPAFLGPTSPDSAKSAAQPGIAQAHHPNGSPH